MVKAHIRLWIIFLFLATLIVPAILSPQAARARLQAELDNSAAIFGPKKVTSLTESANAVYKVVIQSTGIDRFVHSGYVERKDLNNQLIAKSLNSDMSTFTNSYLESMLIQIYGVFYRGALMLQWFIYIGVFLFAAGFDGLVQRRVKQETIQLVSSVKFSLALNTLVAILFVPIAYLLLPATVTPWFMPIWAVVVALPLSKALANAARTS